MAVLEVQGICKTFDKNTVVLRGIDFSLEKGESVAIIGSSGSGKTTLLRCLNFLTTPDEGKILVNGETLFDADDPATQKESEIRQQAAAFRTGVPELQPFPAVYGAAKRDAGQRASGQGAAGLPRAQKRDSTRKSGRTRRSYSKMWASAKTWASIRTSSPADSSSGSPLRARWL